jgi:hypothetical protein
MSKKTYNCTKCDFKAKSEAGLKTHGRFKHGEHSKSHKFDLNIETQEQANELVGHLSVMTATSGWLLLKQIMTGNIAVLEEMILDKKDAVTGEPLSDEDVDSARKTRGVMKEMVEMPEKLIKQFRKQQTGAEGVPTYDPYAVDVRQFNPSSRVGQPRASTLKTE